jgi:Protein of unknown function (DUF3800)
MPRRYIFADESGDLTFARGPNISSHFIVCTVTMESFEVASALLDLQRQLAWDGKPLKDYFHCTTDKQEIRDAVFETIAPFKFKVQATIMEKSKSQPHVRASKHLFFKYGWLYHFRHAFARHIKSDDELLITTASIGTKKGQGVFTDAVNDVIQQHIPREQWRTFFCLSSAEPCLQVADYCSWAIQRKWERGETRAFDLIKSRITYEYPLWGHGRHHYY